MSAIISLSPNYWSFGAVANNSTTDKTATISNVSLDSDMTVGAMTGLSAPYSLLTDLSGTVIPSGGGADFAVRYNPSLIGATNQILSIENDSTNFPIYDFGVDGTSTSAIIQVVPDFKHFGAQLKDSTTDQTVTVTNIGNIDMTIGSLSGLAAPFSIVNDSLSGASIQPSDSSTVVVRYSPTALGFIQDALLIPSNDPDAPVYAFTADGTCQQPIIGVSPTYKSYGLKTPGSTTDQTVTVSNTGNIALVMGSLSGLAAPYSMVANTVSSATINAGDSSTVVVRFSPTAPGTFTDTLVMPSNDPVTASYSFNVDGTSSGADISVSPSSYNFGVVPCNFIADVLVTVSNLGDQTLVMSSVGGLNAPFSVIDDNVSGQVIEANGTRTLSIRFLPRSRNTYAGTLSIGSDDPDTPSFPVTVTGNSQMTLNHGEGRRSAVNGQLGDYIA
jgi:hypothetical protein